MKTKELIKRLQEIDPSGELEITHQIFGEPITFVDKEPAYYDGPLLTMKDGKMYITTEGDKIKLYTHDIFNLMELGGEECVDFDEPVSFEEFSKIINEKYVTFNFNYLRPQDNKRKQVEYENLLYNQYLKYYT